MDDRYDVQRWFMRPFTPPVTPIASLTMRIRETDIIRHLKVMEKTIEALREFQAAARISDTKPQAK